MNDSALTSDPTDALPTTLRMALDSAEADMAFCEDLATRLPDGEMLGGGSTDRAHLRALRDRIRSFQYFATARTAFLSRSGPAEGLTRTLKGDPQTALMLGTNLDPNDATVDWDAECARLRVAGVTTADGVSVEEFCRQLRALASEGTDRAYAMQEDAPEVSALIARLAHRVEQFADAAVLQRAPVPQNDAKQELEAMVHDMRTLASDAVVEARLDWATVASDDNASLLSLSRFGREQTEKLLRCCAAIIARAARSEGGPNDR